CGRRAGGRMLESFRPPSLDRMQRKFILLAMAAAAFAMAPEAMAMGFGQTALRTTLGQPLDFSAALTFDGDETLAPQCVDAEVRAGDARVPPPEVHASLEPARGTMPRSIRVTTTARIDEPVATIDITVGCSSKMSRRFVVFVDPPPVRLAEASPASQPLPPQTLRRDNQSILLGDIARAADASRRGGSVAGAGGEQEDGARTRGTAATASSTAPRSIARAGRAAARSSEGSQARASRHRHGRTHFASRSAPRSGRLATASRPRLQLEPPVALAAPQAAASAPPRPETPAVDVAVAAAAAASSALQRERDRIQVLEAALAGLRSDSQATQRSVTALQARLREAESQRYPGGLVYVLAG